jgi:two-component system, NarL family, sensor histidine kinase UhpB
VELEVVDIGAGFDAATVPEGAGIRGMRERALLVGGEVEIVTAPGAGTTVRLRVPLTQAGPAASS